MQSQNNNNNNNNNNNSKQGMIILISGMLNYMCDKVDQSFIICSYWLPPSGGCLSQFGCKWKSRRLFIDHDSTLKRNKPFIIS